MANEYLFPTPGSELRRTLDQLSRCGVEFSEGQAAMDLMLAKDRGDIKPERYYAKRWGWYPVKVHRKKKKLLSMGDDWRGFNITTPVEVKQNVARVKQNVAKNAQAVPKNGHIEAEVKQNVAEVKQYRTDTYNTTILSNESIVKNEGVLTTVTDKEIMASWNDFARENGLPTIRQLTDDRKRWIRLRRDKIWPVIEEVYKAIKREPHLMGANGWRCTFDYTWRNAANYIKILEGGHWVNGQSQKPQRFNKRKFVDT